MPINFFFIKELHYVYIPLSARKTLVKNFFSNDMFPFNQVIDIIPDSFFVWLIKN